MVLGITAVDGRAAGVAAGCVRGEGEGETDEADRDGPSFDATTTDLSMNRLYWYFAFRYEYKSNELRKLDDEGEEMRRTSDILLKLAVPLVFHHARRRWISDLI